MERMLVVVFDSEKQAFEGESELFQLEREGSLEIRDGAVVAKGADGAVTVHDLDLATPLGMVGGSAVGGLIGLLGGPTGFAIGAASGLALGTIRDAEASRVGADFVDDVSKALGPNKFALVAEVDEPWTTPVDTRMERIGGTVFRRALWLVEEEVRREDIAAMKADVTQFKREISKENAEHKARLQKRIEMLEANIDAKETRAKEKLAAFQTRQRAKGELIKKNAAAVGRAIQELANTPV